MKKLFCLALALVLLLCGCGNANEASLFEQINSAAGKNSGSSSSSSGRSNGPEAVIKQYISAVNHNDHGAFLRCLAPGAAELAAEELEYALEEDGSLTLQDLMSNGARVDLTVHGTLMVGDSYALIDNTLNYVGLDIEERIPAFCCRIDGKWYVDINYDYEYLAESGNTGASSPEKVVDALVNAINRNDIQGLIDIYNPEERPEFAEDLYDDTVLLGYTLKESVYGDDSVKLKAKVEDVWKDGDEAEVYCTISAGSGKEESGEVECIRVNGKWYLLDM